MSINIKAQILEELNERLNRAQEDLDESSSDIRTPGFNQDLAARDTLKSIIDWIEEEVRN